jgi:dihydropteroate synthase
VITHSYGVRRSEPQSPQYDDVIAEVIDYLRARVEQAEAAGIPRDRLVIDPGHDLNKNTLHTLEITRRLQEVAAIGLPTLAAVSNKDFIGEAIDREQGQRQSGSIAAAVICIMNGARIVRMHDVPAAVDAVRLTEAVLGFRQPAYARHNV